MTQEADLNKNPCPVCGSTDFTWGMPIASPPVENLTRVFIYFSDGNGEAAEAPLHARRCNQCGNVLFFTIDS